MAGYYATHKTADEEYALTWIELYGPGHFVTFDTGERYSWENVMTALEDGNCPNPTPPRNLAKLDIIGVNIPNRMRKATTNAINRIKQVHGA